MARTRRVSLVPDRMTDQQLWERCHTLIAACRFGRGESPANRERYLDELRDILTELRLRGTQLSLTAQ